MNLTVKNSMGEQFNIIAVRYFKFNGINYLIFTKNETDEAGYQKLYISKINNMIGTNIDDDIEWNLVRDTIKVIAKANKDNTALPVQDLNEAEVNGIQIVGQKPFKLTVSSVALLSANKNVMPVTPVAPQMDNVPVQPVIPTVEPVGYMLKNVAPVQSELSRTEVPPASFADTFNNVETQNVTPVEPVASVAPTPVVNSSVEIPKSPVTTSSADILASTENNITAPFASEIPNVSPVAPSDPFDFTMPTTPTPSVDTVDYKKLYEEQTLKLNALTVELDKYKSLVDQLKNILS